jgi:hypothetical protein
MRRTIVMIVAFLVGTALLVGLKAQPGGTRARIVAGSPGPTGPPTATTVTGAAIAVRTAQSPTAKAATCGTGADYSISVTLTVSGGRITKASASYRPSPGASQSFADKADTRLRPAILSAQTWNLGPVSRATYAANAWDTYAANAWELSAKDAMTRAGLPA